MAEPEDMDPVRRAALLLISAETQCESSDASGPLITVVKWQVQEALRSLRARPVTMAVLERAAELLLCAELNCENVAALRQPFDWSLKSKIQEALRLLGARPITPTPGGKLHKWPQR